MTKILCFAGSHRKGSMNMALAKEAANLIQELGATATFIDLADYQMPIYDGDIEQEDGAPDAAHKLKKLMMEHDGVFIASPEYNSSISPLLKNTIDWVSRIKDEGEAPLAAFKGKVYAISATSPGPVGGLRGLVPLRMLLGNIGIHVIPTQAAVGNYGQSFDDAGKLVDEKFQSMLKSVVTELVKTTKALA